MVKGDNSASLVAIGKIASAHGVRGQVKLLSYTDPIQTIAAYEDSLQDASGKKVALKISGQVKHLLLATIEGVEDRDAAQSLAGTELYIPRQLLPEPEEGEFYYDDLIGLEVRDSASKVFAHVCAVDNFGAGDVVEIKIIETGKTQLFTFDEKTIPEVNIKEGYILINEPEVENA